MAALLRKRAFSFPARPHSSHPATPKTGNPDAAVGTLLPPLLVGLTLVGIVNMVRIENVFVGVGGAEGDEKSAMRSRRGGGLQNKRYKKWKNG